MTPDDRAQLAQLGVAQERGRIQREAHEMLIETARQEARTRLDMLPFPERDRVMGHLVHTRPDLVIEAVHAVEHPSY